MPGRQVVLMYHSVSSTDQPAVLGSFPVPLPRFIHQLDAARAAGWQFGRLGDLRRPTGRDTLYVTGDDGTVDWVRNVMPWCQRAGIPTHTAIITGPWQTPPVYPVAHRLQALLALSECADAAPTRALPQPSLTPEQIAYIDRVYAYETDLRRRYLKGACNVVFDDAAARALLGPPDETESQLMAERFAAPAEYRRYEVGPASLPAAGRSPHSAGTEARPTYAEFGAHTVSHRAFDGDAAGYLRDEITPCVTAIRAAGLACSTYFTLPMRPRFPATVEQLVPALQAAGFAGVLDGGGEWDRRSFIIPRIDAKNVEQHLGLPAWNDTGAKAANAAQRWPSLEPCASETNSEPLGVARA